MTTGKELFQAGGGVRAARSSELLTGEIITSVDEDTNFGLAISASSSLPVGFDLEPAR